MIGFAVVLVLVAGFERWKTPEEWSDDLKAWIRANEPALMAHAKAVRSGSVDREKGRTSYPPPRIAGTDTNRVAWVSMDANGNVYFITKDSFVTFNVGFVLKAGELLGDQSEPRIVYQNRAFGEWWIYKSN